MESTGRYHLTWARRLAAAGFVVHVLNALLAKRLMGAANALRQNKTDRIKRDDEVKLVETIPGYGEKTAATIVACVPEDLRRWGKKQKVARKLQAYFGCDPKLCESGQWKGRVRMSKRGVELARTALFQAATCALLHDPDMKAVFDRKKAEGKFYLVCVSHVMRIQLRRLVAVLYDRKPFVRSPSHITIAG